MKSKETLTFWLFLFSYSFSVIISIIEYLKIKIVQFPTQLIIIFIIILILGLLLRITTRIQLQKYFNVNIVIRKDHKLINKGIYKYLRHPMYLANILIFLGIAGTFSSTLGIIVTIIFIIPTTIIRINREEKYLKNRFKNQYKKYQKTTYKMVPLIY